MKFSKASHKVSEVYCEIMFKYIQYWSCFEAMFNRGPNIPKVFKINLFMRTGYSKVRKERKVRSHK
jgi:hypothetical protein